MSIQDLTNSLPTIANEEKDQEFDQFAEKPLNINIATKTNIIRFTELMEQEIDELINEGFSDEESHESCYVLKKHVRGKLTKSNVIKANEDDPDQRKAMDKEIEKQKENKVYREVQKPENKK